MTSTAAADDSTVTSIDAAKPPKETRRQRAAREARERDIAELGTTSAGDVNEDDADGATGDADDAKATNTTDTDSEKVDSAKVDSAKVDSEKVDSAAASEPPANGDTTDLAADADEDAEVSGPGRAAPDETVIDEAAVPEVDSETEAALQPAPSDDEDAAANTPETRKQRKARQTIEDATAEREASEAKAAAIAAKQAADAAEKQRAAEQAATRKARFGRGAKRWTRRLAAVAIVGAIGVGAYLAWPTVNERYVQPVESTAADVDTIQTDVLALQDLTSAESGRLTDLIAGLNSRTDELGAETASIQETLDTVVTDQANLETRLVDVESQIGDATRRIDDIDVLAAELGSALEGTNNSAANQLTVMRATELLSRSRLLLYQANYGLAKADLTAARAALTDVPETSLVEAAIARLDLAIANLPQRPVAAAGDIDIAWAALLSGTADAVQPADSFVPPAADQPATSDATTTADADTTTTDEAPPADESDE